MIVSINQPAYLPWLGYFQRIDASDLHVVLDHVQFEKNSFINRNKIRTANGWCWLTIPVKTKNRFGQLEISSLEIDNKTNWKAKHWRAIQQNYSKSPYFKDHQLFFQSVYESEWHYLVDVCREINNYLMCALGISTLLAYSSEMELVGTKSDLIVDICEKVEADLYLSGALGQEYLHIESFEDRQIKVEFQDYVHPHYSQCFSGSFQPYMSVIDLLFNHGPSSLEILNGSIDFTEMKL
jgi:hypothetical protein